ncbi:MAG TPA: hypothetical protein VHL98_10870 [Microvirga sp.]|jgi:hypothetical protein|nr:hypothetical protein [Microvirga sp.]
MRFAHRMDRTARYTDEDVARKLANLEHHTLRNAAGVIDEDAVASAVIDAGVHPLSWDSTNWRDVALQALELRRDGR